MSRGPNAERWAASEPERADDPLISLIDLSVEDPLSPFVLRPGKSHIFSPDGRAVIGYRVKFGMAVVGGDPVGDPLSWSAAVDAFVIEMRRRGHSIAVLAGGERSRPLWAAHGLSAVPIGRDVVVRPDEFDLVGRHFRNLRQAIKRTHNAGVTVEGWMEAEVPAVVRHEMRALLTERKRDRERGFSMILGHPFDGSSPTALILVGRDATGRLVGAHRYLRAGAKDLSLDVPVRVADAPNGLDERLIADAVTWAGQHGIARVSLAFAPFPDLYSDPPSSVGGRVLVFLTHAFDPLIRVERLYRYLRKFHAFDQQRFVMFRWRQVVRVVAALLTLEFSR